MIYIESPTVDPYFNLALEQFVFDEMDRSQMYFMLWQNKNAIIVGKHQNTIREINTQFVKEQNVSVVRRLSGGGAVYHDLGNLNFTFIVSEEKGISNFDFSTFCRPVVDALQKFGVQAKINGRNDITIDERKFSGNSQYAKQGRIMHHGTIMYDSNLDVVSQSLKVSKDKIESKGVQSVRSRVTNVKEYMHEDIPLEEFKETLLQYMFQDEEIIKYELTPDDIKKIEEIKEKRYATWEWNYGASPQYNIVKERRFEDCGKLEVYMEVKDGCIQAFDVFGDYFGNGDKADLQKLLKGKMLQEQEIRKALEAVSIEKYFNHMTKDAFIDLIIL